MPVVADDLNQVFDAIIGRKVGSKPLVIPAAAFWKESGAAAFSAGQWVGAGIFECDLGLPPGTLIESIVWGYNRGGAGTVSLELLATNPIAPSYTSIIGSPIAAGTGNTTTTITAAAIEAASPGKSVIAASTGYSIEIQHTNAANVFSGLVITTRLQ